MSAPLFSESAGQGDLEFLGAVERLTVIIWESLSELEETNWLEKKMSTSKDWVVWCNSKKEGEEDHRFEHHGKNCSLAMMKRNRKLETSRKRRRKKKPVRVSVTDHGGSREI